MADTPQQLAAEWSVPLLTLAHEPNALWPPRDCPLCVERRPLDNAVTD